MVRSEQVDKNEVIVSITGHRPERIFNVPYVNTQLSHAFHDLGATRVNQGMCEGVDLMAAKVAYDMNIPFWAIRPYEGHKAPPAFEKTYLSARVYAEKVITLDPAEYYKGPYLMHNRNRWLVNNCDILVAVWDGVKKGGTWSTIKYAQAQGRPVWLIQIKTMEVGWLQ